MTVLGSDIVLYHTVGIDASLTYLVSQGLAYLLYPMLMSTSPDTCFFFIFFYLYDIAYDSHDHYKCIATRKLFFLGGVAIIIGLIGMELFESTAIQFGMDQMLH